MKLLDKEEMITSNGNISITNLRIQSEDEKSGESHFVSIPLKKVSSIEAHYQSIPWLWQIGGLLSIVGIFLAMSNPQSQSWPIIGVGVVLILIFFLTRKYVVTVSSDGGAKISFNAKADNKENIIHFINQFIDTIRKA